MSYPPSPGPPHSAYPDPSDRTQELPAGDYAPAPYPHADTRGTHPYAPLAPGPEVPGPRAEPPAHRGLRAWHLAVTAALALLLGLGIGAIGTIGADDDLPAADTERVAELEREVADLRQRAQDAAADLARAEEAREEAEAQAAAARDALDEALDDEALADEAPPEEDAAGAEEDPAPDTQATEEYSADGFTFSDVQVGEDFMGSFEVRARMTNDGADAAAMAVTATLLSDGSVVGTAIGFGLDVPAGRTVTLEMFSLDRYTDWDEIEFQVDYSF